MRPSGRCVLIVSSAALLLGGACSTPAQPQAQPTTSRNMWQPPERETASDGDYLCVAPSLPTGGELSKRIREFERMHDADRRAEIVAAALAQRREIVFELLPEGARLDARDTRKYFPPDVIDVPERERIGGDGLPEAAVVNPADAVGIPPACLAEYHGMLENMGWGNWMEFQRQATQHSGNARRPHESGKPDRVIPYDAELPGRSGRLMKAEVIGLPPEMELDG